MSPDLQALYQELILEHNRYPRNYGRLENPTHQAEGYNPLCGDQVSLTLRVEGETIADIRFEGKSCAICRASSSVMTTIVKGRPIAEAEAAFAAFHELVTAEEAPQLASLPTGIAEKLRLFATVRLYPMRVKCATLPWHTLQHALHGEKTPASTE